MDSEYLKQTREVVLADASGIVLEIGVGPGYNLPLYRNVTRVYALDPSSELLAIAKSRAGSLAFPVEFLHTGAEHIPLPDHSVDTAVSTWTLCSVEDANQVLKEVARVLRPGGKFLFADHGASPHPHVRGLQTFFTAITKHFTGNCHYDRSIEQMIEEAGFAIESMEHPRELKPLVYNYQGVAVRR